MSEMAKEVYSIERLKGLHDRARANLRPFQRPNIHLIMADGHLGYPAGAPYAGIVAAAGGEAIPQAWLDNWRWGGAWSRRVRLVPASSVWLWLIEPLTVM